MISPDEAIKRLPKALRRARTEAGLDVETAARRAGVSTLTMLATSNRPAVWQDVVLDQRFTNHESGAHKPSIESLFQLLAAYGTGLAEFQVLLLDARREEKFDGLKKPVRSLERQMKVESK